MKGFGVVPRGLVFVLLCLLSASAVWGMANSDGIDWRAEDPVAFIVSAYRATLGRDPTPGEIQASLGTRDRIKLFFSLIGSEEYLSQYDARGEYDLYMTKKWVTDDSGRLLRLCNCYFFSEWAPEIRLSGHYSFDVARALVLASNAYDIDACPYYDCGYPDPSENGFPDGGYAAGIPGPNELEPMDDYPGPDMERMVDDSLEMHRELNTWFDSEGPTPGPYLQPNPSPETTGAYVPGSGSPPPGYSDCVCRSDDGRNGTCQANGCTEPPNFGGTCFWHCSDGQGNWIRIRGRDGLVMDGGGQAVATAPTARPSSEGYIAFYVIQCSACAADFHVYRESEFTRFRNKTNKQIVVLGRGGTEKEATREACRRMVKTEPWMGMAYKHDRWRLRGVGSSCD